MMDSEGNWIEGGGITLKTNVVGSHRGQGQLEVNQGGRSFGEAGVLSEEEGGCPYVKAKEKYRAARGKSVWGGTGKGLRGKCPN